MWQHHGMLDCNFFFFKQKTAYEMQRGLVGSEMCIRDSLKNRQNLLKVVHLIDIRHAPTTQDKQMYEWITYYGLSGLVVATKADKISKNQLQKNISVIRKDLKMGADDIIIPASALKKEGQDKIWIEMEKILQLQQNLKKVFKRQNLLNTFFVFQS
eukprot:TRINITY_DN65623_c0_g1_i1.p2 TRINITY_DN65623_c0_g1~~TRINITY_DN65623_c0_g1_i1.p2  ORF type:complete len:156 (+),score=28.50 TRINITY_DN65623_c0_g1_i1:76-543(+)